MKTEELVIEGGQCLPSDMRESTHLPYTSFKPNGEQWHFKEDGTMWVTSNGKLIAHVSASPYGWVREA